MAEKTDTPDKPQRTETAPGDENLDKTRTPGDGTLDGSTPAGLTVEQLRERAEDAGSSEPGTG